MNQNDDNKRDLWIKKGLAVYDLIPGNRKYALNDVGAQSLGAFACAVVERHEREAEADGKSTAHSLEMIVPIFSDLAVFVPEMLQLRPAPEPTAPTQQWTDPITGEPAKNPWSEPRDVTPQGVVATLDPQLAAHLKATAEGVSYAFLAKMRAEAEGRAKLRNLIYGEAEHKKNPFVRKRTDMLATAAAPKQNLTAAGEFANTHAPGSGRFLQTGSCD